LLTRRWEKAALHRRSFGGEDSEAFQRLGSALLITTPMLLALHVAAELYVLFDKGLTNSISASIAGLGDRLVMTVFWYVIPLELKQRHRAASRCTMNVGDNQRKTSVVK
jgi:hypothetical protein